MSFSASKTAIDRPPGSNELEMTIFGPGVGECILLHLGDGDWIVVDSCILPGASQPIALDYLIRLGLDPATCVRRIIATHWHDDHIGGLAKILHECEHAEFVMSAALQGQQFFQLVLEVDTQNRLVQHNSSASEFAQVFEVLKSRAASRYVVGPSMYAQDGSRLFRGGYRGTADVWALSPSAATVTNAHSQLAELLLTVGACRRFKQFSPNDLSVAILVQAGERSLLLGADLENTHADGFGWKAVLSSPHRPVTTSGTFKIPHHGSANADHAEVWNSMLVSEPIAVVTPYTKLSKPLPTSIDVERLKHRTNQAYCTTWPPSKKPPRRRGVDGIVRGATKSRRAINPLSGHLRLRVDLSDPSAAPTIELFGSAKQL